MPRLRTFKKQVAYRHQLKTQNATYELEKTTAIALILTLVAGFFWGMKLYKKPLVWSMVNVNYSPLQGDSHLIQTNSGKNILIDAGYLESQPETR